MAFIPASGVTTNDRVRREAQSRSARRRYQASITRTSVVWGGSGQAHLLPYPERADARRQISCAAQGAMTTKEANDQHNYASRLHCDV